MRPFCYLLFGVALAANAPAHPPTGKRPQLAPVPKGKAPLPPDYDYDYVPPQKAPPGKAGSVGKAGPPAKSNGKAPAPAPAPKSKVTQSQMSLFKPANVTKPVGHNDYDYDYTTTASGAQIPKCVCPHEWSPVCGLVVPQSGQPPSKVSFPNRCQAECRTQNITLGVCPGDNAQFQKCYYDTCQADDVNPICLYNTDFPNPCTAKCQMGAMGLPTPSYNIMQSGPCQSDCLTNKSACPRDRICWPKPGKCFQPPCQNFGCLDPTCSNPQKCGPTRFDYVCSQGVTFTNECWANCQGYFDVKKGACPAGARDPWFPHVVPHDPVILGLPDPLAPPTPAAVPLKCVPGLYLNNSACVPCLAGYSSLPGATQCQQCSAGQYAPSKASPACVPCPNGTFSASAGSTACQSCTIPLITLAPGSSSCVMPPLNLYGGSADCNVPDACSCALLIGDCGWSSQLNQCVKDKDTDCHECPKMSVCRAGVNATDPSRAPPAVRSLAVTDIEAQVLKLQWVPPIKNFVYNVDMYQVQLKREDGPWQLIEWPSFGVFGLDPVVSVGGLSPNTQFTLSVTPVSLVGGNGPSTQITVKTLTR